MEERTFGWRNLLGAVNLRDFAQMVRGELSLLASSTGLAVQSASHLPLGPLLCLGGLALVVLRAVLLVLVIVFLGGAIAVISAVRSIARLVRGGSASG